MAYTDQKVQLPPSELGDNRCFEASYSYHGDLVMRTWIGDIDYKSPDFTEDPNEKRFGMAHGADAMILALFVGYYRRFGVDPEETSEVFRAAAGEILGDEVRPYFDDSWHGQLSRIAKGSGFPGQNIGSLNLYSPLTYPRPIAPGIIEKIGGTGIYSKAQELGGLVLVFVGFGRQAKNNNSDSIPIYATAEFCKSDIPLMAQAICDLSLGEYREQIQHFIIDQFPE